MEEIESKFMSSNVITQQLKEVMKNYVYRYSHEPFRLSSGMMSNYYFNCKEITLHPNRLRLLTKAFIEELIPNINYGNIEAIGGLTLGADPISYSLALEYSSKGNTVFPLIVRKESKDHGTRKMIEGFYTLVNSCLVVDDVITTGGSTIKAVEALREAGLKVTDGICILDREENGRENLEAIGVRVHSLFKKSEFI